MLKSVSVAVIIGSLFVALFAFDGPAHASSLDDLILNQNLRNIESELNELNRNIQRDQSDTTFSKISSLRKQLLDKFWSIGMEAFYPSNEGEVRIGTADASCPANSYVLMDMCICNQEYAFDFASSACKDTKQLITVTQGVISDAKIEINNETKNSGKGSKATCTTIKQNLDLVNQLREAAEDKLPSATPVWESAFETSIKMLSDYSEELEQLHSEQCTQKSAQASSRKAFSTVALPPDVTSDAWYASALSSFIDAGWLSAQQSFRPSDIATREEVIRLIVEMNGGILNTPPSQPSFDDVQTDFAGFGWFEEAAKEGWITGQSDCYGKHPCYAMPNDPINRAEAAALMIRAFGLTQGDAPAFEDVPAGVWYGDVIRTAASLCILRGDSGSARVRPAANMNRAEMIVMLYRVDQGLTYPNCN